MKYASDFRSIARQALSGRWGIAVIAGLIAVLLGGTSSNGPEINLTFDVSGASVGLEYEGQQIYTLGEGLSQEAIGFIAAGTGVIILAALVMGAVFVVLGSVVEVGYSRFNLDLVDGQKEPEIGTLFTYFSHWKTATASSLLRGLYVFLWSLLLIIPGIVAGYSYAMTPYILAENPQLTASEAIARSKEMMDGNRWRLFCLEFSFVGWNLLSSLTLGIGELWLRPYRQAAVAAFYREISGTQYALPVTPEPFEA